MGIPNKSNSTEMPVYVVGDCGAPAGFIKDQLAKSASLNYHECKNLSDGFKSLVKASRGIMIMEIANRGELARFARTA